MLNPLSLVQKIVGTIALAVILALSIALFAADRRADKWEAQAGKCAVAREADRNAYVAAQLEAIRLNDEQLQRIGREQRRITDETTRDLNARLERLRSELRNARPAAPQGSARSPKAGPNGIAPKGADGSTGLCLAPEVVLRGAENEERHDQLISWIEQQLKIRR